MGIQTFDYVEFYVGSAKMTAYWFSKALGFDITGYRGPETGVKDRCSYYVTRNDIKFVITSALDPGTHEVQSRLAQHGDHVKRFCLRVDSVEHAYHFALKNGAI